MKDILSILGALGIGGLLSSYFTLLWTGKQEIYKKKQETKEKRYKCIVLLMRALLEFDNYKTVLAKNGYDIQREEDLIDLLKDEHINSFLYASDKFILKFGNFIKDPSENKLIDTALCIRKDLYGIKGKLNFGEIG